MQAESRELNELAARVRNRESGADDAFREAVEPYLAAMARHALRTGAAYSALARRVLAEAKTFGAEAATAERLAVPIARRVCDSMIDGLKAGDPRGVNDTVVA